MIGLETYSEVTSSAAEVKLTLIYAKRFVCVQDNMFGKLFFFSGKIRLTSILLPSSILLHEAPHHLEEPLCGHQLDLPSPLYPVHHSLCLNEVILRQSIHVN